MAGLFCDSFDYYGVDNADVTALLSAGRYNSTGATHSTQSAAGTMTAPRTGEMALTLNDSGTGLQWLSAGSVDTLIVGTGYYWDHTAAVGEIFRVGYDAGAGITAHVRFYRLTTNAIEARASNGTTVIGTSAASVVTLKSWNYLEFKVKVHSSAGTIDVQVDGVNVLSLTGKNTQNGATAVWNSVQWIEGGNTTYIDDVYINDTSGSENNDFLGDVRVYTLDVDGVGTFAQFTPSAGANWQNVDEVVIDGDTTYNSDSVSGQKDVLSIEDLPTGVTAVKFVENVTYARREEGGAAQLYLKTELSTVEQDSAAKTYPTTYAFRSEPFNTDPNGAAWTPTKVNDSNIGYEIV